MTNSKPKNQEMYTFTMPKEQAEFLIDIVGHYKVDLKDELNGDEMNAVYEILSILNLSLYGKD